MLRNDPFHQDTLPPSFHICLGTLAAIESPLSTSSEYSLLLIINRLKEFLSNIHCVRSQLNGPTSIVINLRGTHFFSNHFLYSTLIRRYIYTETNI